MPRSYVVSGSWPDARLVKEAPPSARYGIVFARRLRDAMALQDLNPNSLGRSSGVSRKTIERTLIGEVLPAFGAIARLEDALGVDLWPGPEVRASKDGHGTG